MLMERSRFRRNTVRNRNKSISIPKRSARYIVQASKQNLTPLQRLERFKKLQEKQSKVYNTVQKPFGKRVTFADEMTSEAVEVNGSHEADNVDNDEKILKPRKSILSNEDDDKVLKNGSNENGSVSENGDGETENGHDGEILNGEASKSSKRTLRQKNFQEKREGTPTRQSLSREVKTVKESTPKPETPTKQEIHQKEATPKRSILKPVTLSEQELKQRGTPSKVISADDNSEINVPKLNDDEDNGSEQKSSHSNLIEDSKAEENLVVEKSCNNDKNVVGVPEIPEEKGFFSAFRRISRRSSLEIKDACEASSSSSVNLDSPSVSEPRIVPSRDIKGRKPINSFSRFPGRNVSISSIDNSLKRKAEDSFEEDDRKRFAGETASDSEKSPGWSFFSPSLRVWSPQQANKGYLPSSTPFHKREAHDQDSMAVNYDSKTKLDLDESMESETTSVSSKQKANKWCSIM